MPAPAFRFDALADIARTQYGLFTSKDATDCGFSRPTIRRLLAKNRWREVYPLVYCDASRPPLTWYSRLVALQLSAPNAVITGHSALGLYGVVDKPTPPEVIVKRSQRNLDRVVVHSSLELPEHDIVEVKKLKATRPSRSLIVAADAHTVQETQELIAKAAAKRVVKLDALQRRARDLACAARPGAGRVLRALADMHPGYERARNDWEAAVLLALSRYDVPPPEVNYRLRVHGDWRELDFAWPLAKVFLEYDGYWEHLMSKARFDDDRARDNALEDLGWKGYKVTSRMLESRDGLALVVKAVNAGTPR